MPRRHPHRKKSLYCPTPRKTRWGTLEDAEAALRGGFTTRKVPIRAYQCPAGHWHITARMKY